MPKIHVTIRQKEDSNLRGRKVGGRHEKGWKKNRMMERMSLFFILKYVKIKINQTGGWAHNRKDSMSVGSWDDVWGMLPQGPCRGPQSVLRLKAISMSAGHPAAAGHIDVSTPHCLLSLAATEDDALVCGSTVARLSVDVCGPNYDPRPQRCLWSLV